jgi:adenylate cyclase
MEMFKKINIKKILSDLSIESKDLHYKLTIIFGLFFLVPVMGFGFFAIKYKILEDEFIPIFFIALLLTSYFGYILIRNIFDEIISTSRRIRESLPKGMAGLSLPAETSELRGIVQSFYSLETELRNSSGNLDKRAAQISTLKELSDLCYVTFDTEDLFHITLERALKLTDADIGSVLLLERPQRDVFIVQATIGLGGVLKKGDRVDFKDSIAKFAVLNKSPILVDDIEKDSRFGRISRSQYGTKSFLCMPIRGINEVLGVLTLSRRGSAVPFSQEDIDILAPFLSSAAFAYDNLTLISDNRNKAQYIGVIKNIFKIVNSSLRNNELFQAILTELKTLVPFDVAIILTREDPAADTLTILNFMASIPVNLATNRQYSYTDSVIGKVIKQESLFLMTDGNTFTHPIEQELFMPQKLHSGILSPLKLEGQLLGVFLGSLKENHFNGYQEQVANLSQILPMAIEKDRLTASVTKRDLEMKSIKQIGSMLASSTFEMEGVLKHTMEMIRALMNVEAGSLLLLEEDKLRSKVSFNAVVDVDILKTFVIKLGQGIAGYSAARGESMMVRNTSESPHFSKDFDSQTKFQTRSVLCVPLISLGKVLGVIEVLNKKDGEFNDNDMHLLQSIATSVSIALENARLYQETLSMAEHERGIRNMFQKYVPKEVIDKITGDASEKPVLEELKTLTFLNIDIRDFSILSRNIGPKRTVSILNHFFSVMGEIVIKHHGIVDKYLGDGFLAIFGAPVSSALDADNGIAAAMEMKETIGKINDYFSGEMDVQLTMGISIHTGEAVVGNIGFEKKMDYTVIGDSVNVVFRMQDMTKSWANCILISEITRQSAIYSTLDLRVIGTYDAGEMMGEMKIYELLGKKSRESQVH